MLYPSSKDNSREILPQSPCAHVNYIWRLSFVGLGLENSPLNFEIMAANTLESLKNPGDGRICLLHSGSVARETLPRLFPRSSFQFHSQRRNDIPETSGKISLPCTLSLQNAFVSSMMGSVLAIGRLRLRCTVNGKALRPLFLKTHKGVLTTTALQKMTQLQHGPG